jgi:hypothetical protein
MRYLGELRSWGPQQHNPPSRAPGLSSRSRSHSQAKWCTLLLFASPHRSIGRFLYNVGIRLPEHLLFNLNSVLNVFEMITSQSGTEPNCLIEAVRMHRVRQLTDAGVGRRFSQDRGSGGGGGATVRFHVKFERHLWIFGLV